MLGLSPALQGRRDEQPGGGVMEGGWVPADLLLQKVPSAGQLHPFLSAFPSISHMVQAWRSTAPRQTLLQPCGDPSESSTAEPPNPPEAGGPLLPLFRVVYGHGWTAVDGNKALLLQHGASKAEEGGFSAAQSALHGRGRSSGSWCPLNFRCRRTWQNWIVVRTMSSFAL